MTGTLHEDQYTFLIISRTFLLRMRNVSDKSCRENQNTHFVFSNFLKIKNRAVYEIMWKNTVQPGRPSVTIRRMRTERWIPKAIDTLRICNTICSSTVTMVMIAKLHVTSICTLCVWLIVSTVRTLLSVRVNTALWSITWPIETCIWRRANESFSSLDS